MIKLSNIGAFLCVVFLVSFKIEAQQRAQEKGSMATLNSLPIKDLTIQFAKFFTNKDADAIGDLIADDFALYAPALKWVRGKENVVQVLKKQFRETGNVSYEIVNAFAEGNVGILEFKITLDNAVLYGVDFMHWDNGKMKELRCYYNPPSPPQNEELKPFSAEAKSFIGSEIFEHYSGKRYKILSVGRNSETLEESIVYQALYGDGDVWIRPLAMFLESVMINGEKKPRFKRVL